MRINMKQMGIHILLGLIALVLLFPILFALVNSSTFPADISK